MKKGMVYISCPGKGSVDMGERISKQDDVMNRELRLSLIFPAICTKGA